MRSQLVVLIASAILAVKAQDLSGITACVLGCVQAAATQNNCAFTDVSCVCVSAQFQADALECLESNCTPEEVAAAEALQDSQCGAANLSATGTATARPVPFTFSSTSTATSATTTTTTTGTASTTTTSQTGTSRTSTQTTPAANTGTNTQPPTSQNTTGGATRYASSGIALFAGALVAGAAML